MHVVRFSPGNLVTYVWASTFGIEIIEKAMIQETPSGRFVFMRSRV